MESNFNFASLSLDDLKRVMVKIYKGTTQTEIAEATGFLVAYGEHIESVPVFVQLMTQDAVSEIRLLSAIILKKIIAPHILTMEAQDLELLKRGILERFFQEPQNRVRKSVAVLIAVIMRLCYRQNESVGWTDPLVAVSQKTKADQTEEVRIQGFLLLTTILEIAGSYLSSFYQELFKFFFESIRDSSSTIRKQTLLCVLNMYSSVQEEELIVGFDQIFPLLLEAFYHSLQEKDEDTIEKVLGILVQFTNKKNVLFDNDKITKLLEVFCTNEALLSKEINSIYKETMIDILQNVTVSYKNVISKNENMLRKITEIVFALACFKEEKETLQDRDSIQDVALFYIREMGILLPKKKSFNIFKEFLVKMFDSDNNDIIEGAFYILGNLSDGCREYFRRDLGNIMNTYVQKGLQSPNNNIRKAVFHTINFFANYLIPEFLVYQEMILPPLIKNLDDTSDQKTLQSNVTSLEIFCQEMDDNLLTYLPEIIPRLINLIDQPVNTIPVKRHSLLAISSCAEVAEEKFAPYAEKLLPLLAQLISLEDVKLIEVKSTAVKCVAIILGSSIKQNPELFTNYIEPQISKIYEYIKTTDNVILREFCFEFFQKLASYLQQNFKPYLPKIMELIDITIQNSLTLQVERKQKIISLAHDEDSEAEEDEGRAGEIWVDEDAMEELAMAIRCLGEIAFACPAEFVPYYEKTSNAIQDFSQHVYYNVRMQTLICYKLMVLGLVKLGNNGEIPKYRAGLPCAQRLPKDAEQFLYIEFYEKLFNVMDVDDNIQLLTTSCEILYDLCTELGPAAVDERLERITRQLMRIFNNETNAQDLAFEEDESVHGELFGSATLLMHSLVKACGEGYLTYFDKLYPLLKKFTTDETPEDDVAEVIGVFGQAIKYMNSAAQIYGVDMLDICFKALEYNDEYANRNIGFCIGMIIEFAKEKVFEFYPNILQKLQVLYENSNLADTKDNAIGALGRMVFTNSSLVPLNVVVPGIIKEMPLKGDPKEERTLIKMLLFLFETNAGVLSGMEEKCIELLIDAVISRHVYKIKDENVIRAIGAVLKKLSENEGAKQIIQNCASKLSQENVNILNQLLSA